MTATAEELRSLLAEALDVMGTTPMVMINPKEVVRRGETVLIDYVHAMAAWSPRAKALQAKMQTALEGK